MSLMTSRRSTTWSDASHTTHIAHGILEIGQILMQALDPRLEQDIYCTTFRCIENDYTS